MILSSWLREGGWAFSIGRRGDYVARSRRSHPRCWSLSSLRDLQRRRRYHTRSLGGLGLLDLANWARTPTAFALHVLSSLMGLHRRRRCRHILGRLGPFGLADWVGAFAALALDIGLGVGAKIDVGAKIGRGRSCGVCTGSHCADVKVERDYGVCRARHFCDAERTIGELSRTIG